MDKKNIEEEREEPVNIRHTITAEETFTLAKDVYDLRCLIKNIYANRAVISRRLNIVTLSISIVFTILYTAYVLVVAFLKKLNFGLEVTFYVLLGVYVALVAALIIITLCSSRTNTRGVIKMKKALTVFKILVRLMSIAISITAIVFTNSDGDLSASHVAVDVLIVIFSVITLIIQIIPLLFGGFGKMARWLLSPVKIKYRFSAVVLEWYELAVSGTAKGTVKKVSSKYYEDIGAVIDNYLIPALGKKYISTIKPATLVGVVERADESDKPILEGILNNVFAYATECGYVVFDPCKDLNFAGSVEEAEKPQKTGMKGKLMNMGKKIGKSMLEKYITGSAEEE